MIQDGFGNELTDNELVDNYQKWARKAAGSYAPSTSWLYDDIVQEALIRIWKSAREKPGVSATYLSTAGRYRMIQIVEGSRPMVGGDSTPGPKHRPDEVRVDWQALENPEKEVDSSTYLLTGPDLLDAVDWAYHYGEIAQCLRALPERDRDYVYQRFWQGKTDTEIAAERGVSNKMLGNRWKRTILPALARSLEHLRT